MYYGLLLFILFEYIRPGQYLPILNMLRIPTILALSLFILSFIDNKTITNAEVMKNKNTRWFIFFILLIIVSVFTAEVTMYSFDKFKHALGYILLFFVIVKQVNTINRIKGFFAVLILAHIVLVILSPDVVLDPETRSYLSQQSFLGDGNDFSLSLAIIIPFSMFLFLDEKSKMRKQMHLIVIALLSLCIIGTSSRGGTLALASVFFYMLLKSKRKLWGVVCILMLVCLVLLFAPPMYFERMETISDYENEGSAMGRIMTWKAATKMALENPILGVGAGQFPMKFGSGEYGSFETSSAHVKWTTAHSIYFLILGELGFPGIIFLLSIIISNLWSNENRISGLKKYDMELAFVYQRLFVCLNATLIGFAVGGTFLSALYYPHIYIIVALFVSGEFTYNRNISKINELHETDRMQKPEYFMNN